MPKSSLHDGDKMVLRCLKGGGREINNKQEVVMKGKWSVLVVAAVLAGGIMINCSGKVVDEYNEPPQGDSVADYNALGTTSEIKSIIDTICVKIAACWDEEGITVQSCINELAKKDNFTEIVDEFGLPDTQILQTPAEVQAKIDSESVTVNTANFGNCKAAISGLDCAAVKSSCNITKYYSCVENFIPEESFCLNAFAAAEAD